MSLYEETLSKIEGMDEQSAQKARQRVDSLAKPVGSFGLLEDIYVKMAGITGETNPKIKGKNVVVMCGDNGVAEENVTTCTQDLTAIMANNIAAGDSGVGVMASANGASITVVNVGVRDDVKNPNIIDRRVARGTNNFTKGPAMTKEQAIKAIEAGIETVDNLVKYGVNLIGTGEMGVANTTTAGAVITAISGMPAERVVGMGSGISDEQHEEKIRVVKKGIEVNSPDKNDGLDVLSKIGGYDMAGMCGCFLGAAKNKVGIVIDGVISAAAAYCAYKICPKVADYMFSSHLSVEDGMKYALKEMGLSPMLNLNMRLGEGTGCPLAFNIIESALYMGEHMLTFADAGICTDNYSDAK